MKKIYLFIGSVIVLAVVAVSLSKAQINVNNDVVLANIEALADKESGTPIGTCSKYAPVEGEPGTYYPCDSSTSSEMIYPCPSGSSYGFHGSQGICTK